MHRGLSIIEILIALALSTSIIVATTNLTLGMPTVLENARLERDAYAYASTLLSKAEQASFQLREQLEPLATSTWNEYTGSLTIEYVFDEIAARITANVAWTNLYGEASYISIPSIVTDPELARDQACNPFLLDGWRTPKVSAIYKLAPGHLLPSAYPDVPYPITSLATLGNFLIAGSDTTGTSSQPTLFFFTLNGSQVPEFIGASDNTHASRTGVTGIAVGGGHAYVANGFGSASQQTCADGVSCAQLHIYDLDPFAPEKTASLQLASQEPPYARTQSGATAAARSITYRKGLIFLGLEKTASGFEFNIIDANDSSSPKWLSGVAIGRSVEHIAVTRTHAYVATSDSTNELIVIDIRDPEHPVVTGTWNAPGAANFGIGSFVSVRGPYTFFGRTYVNNAAEFALLDTRVPTAIIPVVQSDTGTPTNPQSIRGIVVRESVAAVMSGPSVHFWDTDQLTGAQAVTALAPSVELEGKGTALVCNGASLIGSSDDGGVGTLHIINGF